MKDGELVLMFGNKKIMKGYKYTNEKFEKVKVEVEDFDMAI